MHRIPSKRVTPFVADYLTLITSLEQGYQRLCNGARWRHDELPKLVETCKQYMKFEQDTLERVMQARASVASAREQGDVGGLGAAEGELRIGLGNLFAVADAYPELKANQSFQHLQARITGLEKGFEVQRYENVR